MPLVGDDATDSRVQLAFARSRAEVGRIPNLYRVLANAPDLLDAWFAFAWPLRHQATAARSVRELVILRVAFLTGSEYEWSHHLPMSLDAGCRPDQVAAISDWSNAANRFSTGERAALTVADRIATGDPMTNDDWDALRAAFDDTQCVELLLTASFYVCVARVVSGLGVPLDLEHPDAPST